MLVSCWAAKAQLQAVLETWKNDPLLKSASFGVSVLEAANSEPVFEYNARQALVPASTLKLVSTSAALQILGADYRFATKLYYTGSFDRTTGVLQGDLIIQGSGDPSLQSENFFSDGSRVTDTWAKALKELGIREITGSIVGDAAFCERRIPDSWIWEDISNYYGATPCGLSYHDNKFTVIFESHEEGSMATIKAYAPVYRSQSYLITSSVIARGKGDEAYAYGDPFSFKRDIKGSIPPGRERYEVELSLPDPALLCAEDLFVSLGKVGIVCPKVSITSNYQTPVPVVAAQLLYTHYSPTLDKLIYFTNLKSNNLYCESLLLALGKGKPEKGLVMVKQHWAARGLDTTELYMEDASGLSRINTLTAHFESQLLCKIYRDSTHYKTINRSLPLAGKQGSMSQIGKGSSIENNLRAKTGYMSRVRAYAGYIRSKSGKDLAFSVILNHYNGSPREAKLRIEKFLLALGEL